MDNNDNNIQEELEHAEALTNELIERAKRGKHSNFVFIRSLDELIGVKKYEKSAQHVADQFYKMWKTISKQYRKDISKGVNSLEVILSAKNCNEIAEFYYKEVEISRDICAEYRAYVFGGHMLDTILGNYRTEDDLVDYRDLPIKWF